MELTDAASKIGVIDTAVKKESFVLACSHFFGKKPGQTLKEFNDELKDLTPVDRIELISLFKSVGFEIV